MFTIEINNQQSALSCDVDRLRRAAQIILEEEGLADAVVNIAIVDDPTIHDLNRRYLDHAEPTDVLSFLLDEQDGLEGDVIASAEMALRRAEQFGWSADDELLLYVIHGLLHLVGYDDLDPASQTEMRGRERYFLAAFGLQPRYDELTSPSPSTGEGRGEGDGGRHSTPPLTPDPSPAKGRGEKVSRSANTQANIFANELPDTLREKLAIGPTESSP